MILLLLTIFIFSALSAYASQRIYSIQVGSFFSIENANKSFDSLMKVIPESQLDYFRIEKEDEFFKIRIGKFEDQDAAEGFLKVIRPSFQDAFIVEGYLEDPEVVRRYDVTSFAVQEDPIKSVEEIEPSYDPSLNHARAKEFIREGNFQEALELLAPFIEDPMVHPDIFSDYLAVLVWEEHYDEAIAIFENLPPMFPRRAYLMRNVGKAYYESNEYDKAFSLYQAALKETPLDEEARKGLVSSLVKKGDYIKAIEYIDLFLEESPSIDFAFMKADLLLRTGRYIEALRVYSELVSREDIESERVAKIRDDIMASLPYEERQRMLKELHAAAREDTVAHSGYILLLILDKKYKTAIDRFESAKMELDSYEDDVLCWIAWAYFKAGNIEKATYYYQSVLNKKPDYMSAKVGLAYCLSTGGESKRALEMLDEIIVAAPQETEARFARAFVYERSGELWSAIKEYDSILSYAPENKIALKLKLQNISDLGGSSIALEGAYTDFPDDAKLIDTIKSDMAVDRVQWGEPVAAIGMLLPLLEDRENMRARYDYIVALAENDDMEDVVNEYESLVKAGVSPPPWVLENVAKAYLNLEQPKEALKIYDEAVEANPALLDAQMGKFYTLQEMRKWREAEEILDGLDSGQPVFLGKGRYQRPNWFKLDLALARAWCVAYEERLGEAEDRFWSLREAAPAHMGIRSGLAHVYLWRGWHRKALREFNIVESLEPKDYKTRIGKAAALNELAYKEQARETADTLIKNHPKDKHVQELVRLFEVEEMAELYTDFVMNRDEDDFEEIRAEITFAKPVSLYTTLYGSVLWQESSQEEQKEYYRRAGIGIVHIFNSTLSLRQRFSINYDDGDDFGSYTEVTLTPNDYWRFNISYDTFTTDVPLRARVFGIESDKLDAFILYRESEWRSYSLLLSRMEFSDDNKREQVLVNYEQGLFVKNDWKMRIFLELYASRNSRDDAPYFNPDHDWSLSATHMTEQILWRIYRKAFIHRLYLTCGTYKQDGYPHELIWTVRYQQDHDFSDTHALVWGLNMSRRAYDGEPVHSYGFYLTYRWRF